MKPKLKHKGTCHDTWDLEVLSVFPLEKMVALYQELILGIIVGMTTFPVTPPFLFSSILPHVDIAVYQTFLKTWV